MTTPQEVALQDVRKEINFCRQTGIRVIGVIENMSGLTCPSCTSVCHVFEPTTGGAEKMCKDMGVPFLGKIPMSKTVMMSGEQVQALEQTIGSVDISGIVGKVISSLA